MMKLFHRMNAIRNRNSMTIIAMKAVVITHIQALNPFG
jgi:hypothetical protein